MSDAVESAVYSALEVATMLGVNLKTVYRGCTLGQIPHRRVGRAVLFPKPWIDAWLRGEPGTAPAAIPTPAPRMPPRRRKRPSPRVSVAPSTGASSRAADEG